MKFHEPSELGTLREGLVSKGYNVVSAEVDQIPSTYTTLTDEEHIKKMNLLLEHLEDNDDVPKCLSQLGKCRLNIISNICNN